ncbi:uncharacterized protein LOC141616867 [Silene latifolia]|uniref:uncharacterized protein LOC141616867 n=1 Tax=Silene latifolia TaxID=37657 RepID=UPI003D77C0E1
MLNGDNYDEWSVKLRGAFSSRKKTGFLDGLIKRPAEDSEVLEDWSQITYVEEAKILWDDIEQRFSVGNGPKTHRVKCSILACKQGDKESVSDYYGRLKWLWDDFDKYDRNPICDCGGYKCNINRKLDKKRDEEKVHDFLMGLDSKFATVRSSLQLQELLPTLNRAYATIIQEEGVQGDIGAGPSGVRSENRADPDGFSARTGQHSGSSNNNIARSETWPQFPNDRDGDTRPRCSECNCWGHTRDKCYDVIGHPNKRGGYRGGYSSGGNRGGGGRDRGGGRGTDAAHFSSVTEDVSEAKEEYVSVPKGQWDAYVNNVKTREKFIDSDNKAIQIFGLIHCDLWGDYRTQSSCGSRFFTVVDDYSQAVWHPRRDGDKFASRSRHVFVGFPYGKKGWEVYDIETHEFFVSWDVVFDESVFPFHDSDDGGGAVSGSLEPHTEDVVASDDEILFGEKIIDEVAGDGPLTDIEVGVQAGTPSGRPEEGATVKTVQPTGGTDTDAGRINVEYGRGKRPLVHAMDVKWRDAMYAEIDALVHNNTWDILDLSVVKKIIGNKWVYKVKLQVDGSVERYKARLVVLGNRQEAGIDYYETFAPTAKMVTVRIFLAIVASRNWELHQMDVHNVFLHGDLEEEVYMKLPQDYFVEGPGKVCRLRKSLYGLRQAPRCWFAKLSAALIAYGFVQCLSDYSLFSYAKDGVEVYILVYVDNLLIGGTTNEAIRHVKSYLGSCFHMKDLGGCPVSWKMKKQPTVSVSSTEAEYRSMAVAMCEIKWVRGLLRCFGVTATRPAVLQCDNKSALSLARNPVFHAHTKHIEIDCHVVRDAIRDGILCPMYVHTSE